MAGLGRGDFYAEPKPAIKIYGRDRYRRAQKVLVEKYWPWKCF
jgi:hypothetical protein